MLSNIKFNFWYLYYSFKEKCLPNKNRAFSQQVHAYKEETNDSHIFRLEKDLNEKHQGLK